MVPTTIQLGSRLQMKKVLVPIYTSGFFGGFERRVIRICEALSDSFDIHYAFFGCSKERLANALGFSGLDGIKGRYTLVPTNSVIGRLPLLLTIVRARPDVIWLYDYSKTAYMVRLFASLFHRPALLSVVNYFLVDELGTNPFLDRFISNCTCVDLLYPQQEGEYSKLNRNLHVTPGTFTDLDAFWPRKKGREFVFISAVLKAQKNPGVVIEAVRLCRRELRTEGYGVTLCGDGGMRARLEGLVLQEGLDDLVTFRGYCNPQNVLPTASALLAVQNGTNYPSQTIAEAAASGCFVIVFDNDNSATMVDPSFSALVPCNGGALASAMVAYMGMADEERRKSARNARRFAEENFSIDRSAEYFRGLIDNL